MQPPVPSHDPQERPVPVGDAARRADLGRHRATFGPVKAESITWFVVFTAGFAAAAIGLLLGGQLAALLPAAPAVLFGYITAQRIRLNGESRNARLELFERGAVIADAAGVHTMPYNDLLVWQEIVHHSVNGRHNHTTHKYELQSGSGPARALHATTGRITAGFPDPAKWGPAIQQSVTDARYPAAWSAIAAGQRLDFGKFWITSSHIGSRNREWPWSTVSQIRTHDGLVQIKSGDRWRSLTDSEVARIPNYFILLTLAERLCAAHRA